MINYELYRDDEGNVYFTQQMRTNERHLTKRSPYKIETHRGDALRDVDAPPTTGRRIGRNAAVISQRRLLLRRLQPGDCRGSLRV